MSLIAVTTNTTGYEYDIHSLIKAFYPECDVRVIAESDKLSSDSESRERSISYLSANEYSALEIHSSEYMRLSMLTVI